MDAEVQGIANLIANSGPFGLAIVSIGFMGWLSHKQRIDDHKAFANRIQDITETCMNAHHSLEDKLVVMVEKNTEALTKSAMTTENCSNAIREIGFTLNSAMNLLTQLSMTSNKK